MGDPFLLLFSFLVTLYIYFIIKANIEYKRDKEVAKSEEEKFEEWLDNQW